MAVTEIGLVMWRLIRFLFTGDGHGHKWKFTSVDRLTKNRDPRMALVKYVKVCEICGAHRHGKIFDCWADSAEELNL